jgi:hypothetical protein
VFYVGILPVLWLLDSTSFFAGADAAGCCAACRNHTGCDAWSWGGPKSRLPLRCYLKDLSRTRPGAGKATGFTTGSATEKPLPPVPSPPPPPPIAPLPFHTEVAVDATASAPVKSFAHYWKKAFGSGHAKLTLRKDWQDHLKQATEQLGLTGVRHHGWVTNPTSAPSILADLLPHAMRMVTTGC